MRGRLNLFQRSMLRWRDIHPYSAVHVVRIDSPLDAAALAASIEAQVAAWGLTGFTLDARRRRFDYQGGSAAAELVILSGTADPEVALDVEIERQLNLPFAIVPGQSPFRFFAVPLDEAFHLGVAYDHFIAGGDAIAGLLAAIAARHGGTPDTGAAPQAYPPTYRNYFARHPVHMLRALAQLPRLFGDAKRAVRPRYPDPDDGHNAYAHFRFSAADAAALRATQDAWSVSLNDLLIAALMRSLSPVTMERRSAPRRREIAVSSIVNIRRDFGARAQGAFGQFLAIMRVMHPVPEGIDLATLAREIHRATAEDRRVHRHLRSILPLGVAGMIWPFLQQRHRKRFFTKHTPALGGVTLLHVDSAWSGTGSAPPRDYLRAVSTGPTTPIVLAVSTVAGALSVGVSYRRTAVDRSIVAAIESELRACAAGSRV